MGIRCINKHGVLHINVHKKDMITVANFGSKNTKFSKSLKNIPGFVTLTMPVMGKHSSNSQENVHTMSCVCAQKGSFYIALIVMILLQIFSIKISIRS